MYQIRFGGDEMAAYSESINKEEIYGGKYLTFFLDKESYAIDVERVKEIISVQPMTKIPCVYGAIKGIINLRGKVVTVMDMRLKLGKVESPYNDRTCVVIVEGNGQELGLIVDYVQEVLELKEAPLKLSRDAMGDTTLITSVIQQNEKLHQIISSEILFKEGE